MIGLIDFLKAAGIKISDGKNCLKIHLACWNGSEHPIDEYYAGRFMEWQEDQTRRNFRCDQVLALIDMGQSRWLFAGVYAVGGCKQVANYYQYTTSLIAGQNDLVGRIVVQHKRTGRASYLWYVPEIKLPVEEVFRKKLSIGEFPGFNAVTINHSNLKTIVEQKITSWFSPLSNIKGVYLITDTSTGKLYVGSAVGSDGIWQRWSNYAYDGHGDNKDLKKLLKEKGQSYVTNFQYSILEIADTHASDKDVLSRESYWKNALCSRKYGLNSN